MEKKNGDLWHRVTCAKRIDRKVSQALREGAPDLRVPPDLTDDTPVEDVTSTMTMLDIVGRSDTTIVSIDSTPPSLDADDECDSNQSDASIAWDGGGTAILDDSINECEGLFPVWLEDLPLVENLTSGVLSV